MKPLVACILMSALSILMLPATAQERPFQPPPREAFGLGLVMDYESGIAVELYRADIRQPCGGELGCFEIEPDGTCTVMIDLRVQAALYDMIVRHLYARCAGWEPE